MCDHCLSIAGFLNNKLIRSYENIIHIIHLSPLRVVTFIIQLLIVMPQICLSSAHFFVTFSTYWGTSNKQRNKEGNN